MQMSGGTFGETNQLQQMIYLTYIMVLQQDETGMLTIYNLGDSAKYSFSMHIN